MGLWEILTTATPEQVKALAADHTGLMLLVCFVSGILTSLTPCVYPMIPITLSIFGRAAQAQPSEGFNRRTFFLSVLYVAGMCVTYSALGLVAGLTGSLFGKALQSAYLLGFLALLFLGMALAQLGIFKVALPASLQTRLSSVGSAESRAGVFVMGLISGIIVSPCVGPVVGGILAFVLDTANAVSGLLYFLSFSLGLGVLFLVIGAFSGLLQRLPRSGPWMVRINVVLSLFMLIASAYYGLLFAKQTGLVSSPSTLSGWLTDEDQATALAKAQSLPLLVDFSAEWCTACHEIEETIFRHPKFLEKAKGFVLLRLDVTAETAENEEKLRKYNVLALPTITFVSRKGEILQSPRVLGVISIDEFIRTMDQILTQ